MSSTADVLDQHLAFFGKGDVDGLMSLYTASTVVLTAEGPLTGPDALRRLMTALVTEFGQPGVTFEVLRKDVEGECAFFLWKGETPDNVYELGSDTYVIRDGKIVYQSYCAKIVAKR